MSTKNKCQQKTNVNQKQSQQITNVNKKQMLNKNKWQPKTNVNKNKCQPKEMSPNETRHQYQKGGFLHIQI